MVVAELGLQRRVEGICRRHLGFWFPSSGWAIRGRDWACGGRCWIAYESWVLGGLELSMSWCLAVCSKVDVRYTDVTGCPRCPPLLPLQSLGCSSPPVVSMRQGRDTLRLPIFSRFPRFCLDATSPRTVHNRSSCSCETLQRLWNCLFPASGRRLDFTQVPR